MKILVTHVPAGSGHQRAAEAIVEAFSYRQDPAEVLLHDALEGTNWFYQWCFTRGYLDLIHGVPFLWGVMYHLTDIKGAGPLVEQLHRLSNGLHGRHFENYLLQLQPDVVIGTHFFPMEVAATLKSRGLLSAHLITVITDFLPHALWIAPGIDTYVVASEPTREDLLSRGIPPDRIVRIGIPVDPKFSSAADGPALARRLDLAPDRFTVLIGSGGAGTGPIVSLVETLDKMSDPLQLLVIAGKNLRLYKRLEALKAKIRHPMKIFGFINNMEELMEVSDILISKPGGLTCAEAMAKGLPSILVHPIPGQETRNAQAMIRMGAAVWASRIQEIPALLKKFRQNPEDLRAMGRNARENSVPDAALKIAELAVRKGLNVKELKRR